MRAISWFRQTIASLLFISSSAALADESCRTLFADHPSAKAIDHLLPTYLLPLDPEFMQAVRAHPGLRKLSWLTRGGAGYRFIIDRYHEDADNAGSSGESIQARMVAQILQAHFPNASIDRFWHSPSKPGSPIELRISDTAEWGHALEKSEYLEMAILKAANPNSIRFTKPELRDLLGIRADARVASFYMNQMEQGLQLPLADNPQVPSLEGFLAAFDQEFPLDVLILSDGGASNGSAVIIHKILTNPDHPFTRRFKQVVEWKDLRVRQLEGLEGPILIMNPATTRGRMMYLHRMADIAVTKGAINHFEPLNAGTSTIGFNNSDTLDMYNQEAFDGMMRFAEATGGLAQANAIDQLAPAIRQLLGRPSIFTRPYEVRIRETSPLDRMLAQLERRIRSELPPALILWLKRLGPPPRK